MQLHLKILESPSFICRLHSVTESVRKCCVFFMLRAYLTNYSPNPVFSFLFLEVASEANKRKISFDQKKKKN